MFSDILVSTLTSVAHVAKRPAWSADAEVEITLVMLGGLGGWFGLSCWELISDGQNFQLVLQRHVP